jgi:hypothetical protein
VNSIFTAWLLCLLFIQFHSMEDWIGCVRREALQILVFCLCLHIDSSYRYICLQFLIFIWSIKIEHFRTQKLKWTVLEQIKSFSLRVVQWKVCGWSSGTEKLYLESWWHMHNQWCIWSPAFLCKILMCFILKMLD